MIRGEETVGHSALSQRLALAPCPSALPFHRGTATTDALRIPRASRAPSSRSALLANHRFSTPFRPAAREFPGRHGACSALDPVSVRSESAAIDLRRFVERSRSDGDLIQISTAPGADGIVRRIAIKAKEGGSAADWIVFALNNDSNEQVDALAGGSAFPAGRIPASVWPDLGATRITAVTASQGESPERRRTPRPTSSRSSSIPARP